MSEETPIEQTVSPSVGESSSSAQPEAAVPIPLAAEAGPEVAAGPVYRLLGETGLGTVEFPPVGKALINGDLGFRQHSGGHTPVPNWPAFLEFADRHLHAPVSSPVLAEVSPGH